jgi:hypothetical protein
MKFSRRGPALAAVLSLIAAAGSLLTGGAAQAQPVTTGSFSVSGDAGEFITRGLSYAYSTHNNDLLSVSSVDGSTVSISVEGANGDRWSLSLDAPATQILAPGTYTGATRYPFNGAGPGLDFGGNGSGCNELTGSFTIINAVFGPSGYVQTFDATFEQHCEGIDPAARGEVHIANPPPPPALEYGVTVTDGTANLVNGAATVHGTVSCNKATLLVYLNGTIVQANKGQLARGSFFIQLSCTTDAPTQWTATVNPEGLFAFVKGDAEATIHGVALDQHYGSIVEIDSTATVKLVKVKP